MSERTELHLVSIEDQQKTNNQETQISDLSGPIHIDILSRIPTDIAASSCRLVSKSWLSMMSDPLYNMLHCYVHTPTILLLPACSSGPLKYDKSKRYFLSVDQLSITPSTRKIQLPESLNRFELGNSCNGLINVLGLPNVSFVCVTNPLLGQWMSLPTVTRQPSHNITFGLGFSPETNQYKVVKVFQDSLSGDCEAEICTLGSNSIWRSLGKIGFSMLNVSRPVFYDRYLHWIVRDNVKSTPSSEHICCFDFQEEKFGPFPGPPALFKCDLDKKSDYYWTNIGVIQGCLYICATERKPLTPNITIWMMKDYRVEESWTKTAEIKSPSVQWWKLEERPLQLLKVYENGNVLLLCGHSHLIFCGCKERRLLTESGHGPVFAHFPSFVSVKNIESTTYSP